MSEEIMKTEGEYIIEQAIKAMYKLIETYLPAWEGGAAVVAKSAIENLQANLKENEKDATRYNWLRSRELETIKNGGVFAVMSPANIVLNGGSLDEAIDFAISLADDKEDK